MKRILLAFALLISTLGYAQQQDPAAQKLLDEVSKKYDAYHTIQSRFQFTVQQPEGDPYTDEGILFLQKKKNQFKIQLPGQDLISNGQYTWSILKEDKEVQITEAQAQTDAIGPNNIFTFYKKGFKYMTMDSEQEGKHSLSVVELVPTDTQKNYFKIKLRVNKNKHIHDVLIYDKSGARYSYTIQGLYVNTNIEADKFIFNKANYPNYELVDLR